MAPSPSELSAAESLLAEFLRVFHRSSQLARRFLILEQLPSAYAPLADHWAVWNSESSPPELIAESKTCTAAGLRTILDEL